MNDLAAIFGHLTKSLKGSDECSRDTVTGITCAGDELLIQINYEFGQQRANWRAAESSDY